MHSTVPMKRADQVLMAMRRHRAATPSKQPVHPGMTRRELPLTGRDSRYLTAGVLAGVCASPRQEDWWIDRVAVGLALAVMVVLVSGLLGGWTR